MELNIPHEITIGGLVREGQVILVEGKTQILAGDMVMVFSQNASPKDLNKLFG